MSYVKEQFFVQYATSERGVAKRCINYIDLIQSRVNFCAGRSRLLQSFRTSSDDFSVLIDYQVKSKAKLSLCPSSLCRMEWGEAPLILNFGATWKWVVSIMPQPLYPQSISPWYTFVQIIKIIKILVLSASDVKYPDGQSLPPHFGSFYVKK
jgi:hypothetical protein